LWSEHILMAIITTKNQMQSQSILMRQVRQTEKCIRIYIFEKQAIKQI